MTAQQFVLERMPKARCERHVSGYSKPYYLIRDGREYMYFAEGTSAQQWVNAKKKLVEIEKKYLRKLEPLKFIPVYYNVISH